jgi:peptidoglycan hydrolase CwlO-like protein
MVILALCIWVVATRASRNYAQSIDVALSQAVRELADTTNNYKNDLKDEVRDLRNQIDRLRSEAETATNNLQVDVGSQEKKMCSMRADIISLESRVQTKRRHYPDDFPPP